MNPRAGEKTLIEKLRSLTPQRQAEVEDFIDFLRAREEAPAPTCAAAKTAEPPFAAVWENDEDADYDRL